MKAFINADIYDFVSFRKNCYVLFDSSIEEIGPMSEFNGAEEVIDCDGCLVMPGLVNCHTHIYSTFSRGMNIPFSPRNFKDILEQLWWKLDRQLDNSAAYYSGLVYGSECIKNGVTSIIDHHASGLSIRGSLYALKKSICDDLGLRGIFCFETSDRFNVEDCIDENMEFGRDCSENFSGLFGMHASMSLSDTSLKKISARLGNMPVHVHVAESRDDVIDCYEKHKKSIVERLDSFNLLNSNSILAHCVYIDKNEARIIRDRGCYIAVNPTSNMNNAVGLADFELFRNCGNKCIIGSDGLGSSMAREYQNMVFGMRNRLGSPTGFSLDDLIQAILNGYQYISSLLNIKLGRIAKGYKADMITVPYIAPTPMDESNISGHLLFGIMDNFHPRDAYVSGKSLLRNYKPEFDMVKIVKNSREEAVKVWNRISL